MITREEGYERAVGKEHRAMRVATDFLADVLRIKVLPIGGADDNYRFGDLLAPSGETIEVKSQPIDPAKYERNFVEVCEITCRERHRGGLATLADLLDVDVERIASTRVRLPDGTTGLFGQPEMLSVSVRSMTVASYTMYVNADDGGRHIYFYERQEILTHLVRGIDRGMVRGAGQSNADTFGVFIPLARMRWERRDGTWEPHGVDMSAELHGRLCEP